MWNRTKNNMNKLQFKELIQKNFKNIPNDFFDLIEKYKNFVQTKNKLFNLTNFANDEVIYQKYFFDSIIDYKPIDFLKINNVLDIGSGSGIPGIIIKLLFRHINLTIIEATNKKVKFLNELVNYLNLQNITIINKRAEKINDNEYESFDLVTSRAVAELRVLLEISTPYAKISGLIVEPKSKKYNQELIGAKNIMEELDLSLINEYDFNSNKVLHHTFVFKKNKKTNHKYPRNWKQIIS